MNKLIKVAVDAMGGDNAPQKIIDGIELHHKKSKNTFYRLFGNKNITTSVPSDLVFLKRNFFLST